jgi:hypothetical protein
MRKVTIIISLFTALLSSCSENPPEIDQQFWQINRFNDLESGEIYDTLSLFLLVEDPDGIEDISSLYIINDSSELFWKLSPEDWVIKENQGVTWIGSNRIKTDDRSMFPTGNYRALVIDEAGERVEHTFYLKNSSFSPEKKDFPVMNILGKSISVESSADVIWIYRNDGSLITENYTNGKKTAVPFDDSAASVYLYKYDRKEGMGLVSGPFTVNVNL